MFGQRLRELREQVPGRTQPEIAALINVNPKTYSNWERERSEPDFKSLFLLADFYGMTLDYLMGRSDEKKGLVSAPDPWRPLIREATEKSIHPRQLHMAMLLIDDLRERLAGVPEDPVPPEWRQWVQELIDAGLDLDVAKQVIKSVTAYEQAMKGREKGRG